MASIAPEVCFRPLTIEEYEKLIEEFCCMETPMFPMTEERFAHVLWQCGFQYPDTGIEMLREEGKVQASKDAWGREAAEATWECLRKYETFCMEVACCCSLGTPYFSFQRAYLLACQKVRAEFGDIPSVAGMFGDQKLVSLDSFVKTFHPPRYGEDPKDDVYLVEFELAAPVRLKYVHEQLKFLRNAKKHETS